MTYILKIFILDIELLQLYRLCRHYYNVLCNFCNNLLITKLLQKFKFKLNKITMGLNYSLFLGQGIIYLLFVSLFLFSEVYIQIGLGIFLCLDYIIKEFNYLFRVNVLTPSLNVYYPIYFSIFSVTIRITGVFLSLILGVHSLC